MPERASEDEKPRILQLREQRYHLEFDAPDDAWLATGPKMGMGDAQRVWTWRKGKRQIDVHVPRCELELDPAGAALPTPLAQRFQ